MDILFDVRERERERDRKSLFILSSPSNLLVDKTKLNVKLILFVLPFSLKVH